MDGARNDRTNAALNRQLRDQYEKFLHEGHKLGSPREAHLFALAMRHRGLTFNRSVEQVVVELAGDLPLYWSDPFHLKEPVEP